MAIHMRNGIPYGGIPNGIVSGETPSTVPTTVKQLNQVGAVGKIAPVTIPSAVKFSNGDTLETAIGSVATIETSPTVATHEVGEFIFYNGQMYRVIATIAVGETLTVDTNIEATSVGAELTSLNNGLNNLIKHVTITDTTDASGNISSGSTATRILLGAVPDRRVNANISSALITTTAAGTSYMLHCIQSNGSVVASQRVSVICTYIDGALI